MSSDVLENLQSISDMFFKSLAIFSMTDVDDNLSLMILSWLSNNGMIASFGNFYSNAV